MNTNTNDMSLAELSAKIDCLTDMVSAQAARAARQQELIDEMMPIAREALTVGGERLQALEQAGYFTFARETARVFDRVVSAYGEDDLRQLGENVVAILDTVKRVTQPDMLAIARDATAALDQGDAVEARGVLGMLRESRDPDVRRGVAMVLEVLRYVGRGTARVSAGEATGGPERSSSDAHAKLARLLGPSRPPADPAAAPLCAAPSSTPVTASPTTRAIVCRLVADDEWSPAWAEAAARIVGVEQMTDDHWKVVEFARREFLATQTSPNVRKIALSSGVDTKTLYAIWPTKPGLSTAFVAGIPTPRGCL